MPNKSKKLILIDGNAIIHRSYHALPPLTTKKGELVNAVYGFSSTILSVIEKFKPDYVVASFDLAGPTFRHKEFAEYKAHRVKADQELYDQIPRVKEVTRAMGIPIVEKEGFEADDVIGTLSKLAGENKENLETIIVTGDLDTLQLVDSKTKVYTMRRGLTDSVLYDEEKIDERYGLKPSQLIDYKGLRGDPSDNIPGVKGVGEKTAIELLKEYKSLENVYSNIEKIKGALKEKLERDKMQAIQSKKLATIVRNVPMELDLEAAKINDFGRQKTVELFKELNFFSLIKRLPENDSNNSDIKIVDSEKIEQRVKDFKFELITEKELDNFINILKSSEEVAIYLRTQGGGRYFNSDFKGIAISYKTGRAGYIEYSKNNFEKLKTILENESIKKIGYDLKYDLQILKRFDIDILNLFWDVMISSYVLNPGGKMEFSNIVLESLGEEVDANKKNGQLGLEIESPEEISQKACRRADYIFKLKNIHAEKISEISSFQSKEKNLENVFYKVEMPLVPILAEMEMNGVRLNTIIFKGISEKIEVRINNLEKSIYELAGEAFNINSPKQLAEVLFSKMQLPTADIKKGKTGYSTASAELQKLKGESKIIEKIEEYREIFKLKTTYLDTLPTMIDKDSRIHSAFNQAVTATGRLSSSDPNLQNIPIRTDIGQLLRTAFEAEEGKRLVSADYSQIDLRVVAHVSNDKNLIETFMRGEDIHRATASIINKIPMSQVTEKMRSRVKALNFGVIYGMSVFGFSAAAGISREEAKKFIDAYFEKFTGVAEYMRSTKLQAKEKGYVETEIGRRRYVPEINSPNFQVQNAGERMAINMPIQGLTADIMKLAMIEAEKLVKTYGGKVRTILQVHDELIFEVEENVEKDFCEKLKTVMENVYKLKVPLVANVEAGDNWGEI